MSGNPVEIRSGCATVTGYKLPEATESLMFNEQPGRRERGQSLKSGYRFECARRGLAVRGQLLRKEKDEASLCRVCEMGFPECLHSPILRGMKVFYFEAMK